MPNLETIAIILGMLIVITRLPVVFWPKKVLSYWKRKIAKESSAKTCGAIVFLVGLIFIYFIRNEISLIQLLVGGLSIGMTIVGLMIFLVPKLPLNVLSTLEKKLSLVRALAFIAVLIGILLISLGY